MKPFTFLLISAAISAGVSSCSEGPEMPVKKKYTKMDALFASRVYVKQTLVDPGTAKFSSDTSDFVPQAQINDSTFMVSSTFDAPNEYGVLTRHEYNCKITLLPDFQALCEDLSIR